MFHPDGNEVFRSLNTDFVCRRGILTNLLCAPYETEEDGAFTVAVIRFRGTYYIEHGEPEKAEEHDGARDQAAKIKARNLYRGLKFEQCVTSDQNLEVSDTDRPVNKKETFYSVVHRQLGAHSLVFASAVDCWDRDNDRYIELKTVQDELEERKTFSRYKVFKWWTQCILHPGIENLVCGFPDGKGIVHRMKDFPVNNLPHLAAETTDEPWKPVVCFKFLDRFLQHVKETITEDNEKQVYIFKIDQDYDRTDMTPFVTEDPQKNFLPAYFVNWEAWDK